jgi:hypothetical protein
MKPRPGVAREELAALVEEQARAFQNLPSFWSPDHLPGTPLPEEDPAALEAYQRSSRALAELIELPTYPPTDIPDLDPRFRVSAITGCEVFPPQLRLAAYRSYLPDELPAQLARVRNWLDRVRQRRCEGYLCRLYAYETSLTLWQHSLMLRHAWEDASRRPEAWADLTRSPEVSERVRMFPVLAPLNAPALPPQEDAPAFAVEEALQAGCWRQAQELAELTRAWDAAVKEPWKVQIDRAFYSSPEQFRREADGPWLREFLEWARRCCEAGFGLFLEY